MYIAKRHLNAGWKSPEESTLYCTTEKLLPSDEVKAWATFTQNWKINTKPKEEKEACGLAWNRVSKGLAQARQERDSAFLI